MMTEDDILKEQLMQGIDLVLEAEDGEDEQADDEEKNASGGQDDASKRLEEEQEKLKKIKPVPVYKQLAGLPNLGKVFFINESELKNKDDWTQTQMTNLYGAELYGSSAQAQAQNGDGEGREIGDQSSLIVCRVSTLMNLPSKGFVKEANNYGEKDFKTAMGEFAQSLEKLKKDGKITDKDYESVHNIAKSFNYNLDSSERQNQKAWSDLTNLFKKDPWKSMNNQRGSEFQNAYLALRNYYTQWETGGASGSDSGFFGRSGLSNKSSTLWNNLGTCRIDIRTNFDENWYKRKFKSGMLNKMIYAIKTDAMKNAPPGVQANDTNKFGHKWSADTMEDGEKRKLDSIRWKMTNKVANDYIRLLLGWTRKKEMYMEDGNYKPMQEVGDMTRDDAFGKEMAKKALGNRGILGRLKQKLFSGQQSSNVISVAFQMADFGDGWELVELRGDNEVGGEEAAPEDDNKQPKEEQPKKKEEMAAESITQEYVSSLIDECLCSGEK